MDCLGYDETISGTFVLLECPNCFEQDKFRMELYNKKW